MDYAAIDDLIAALHEAGIRPRQRASKTQRRDGAFCPRS
jgi:hypothetical protein